MAERKVIRISAAAQKALDGSVEKWNRIVAAFEGAEGTDQEVKYEENGPDDCPLCVRYHPVKIGSFDWTCAKACPIKKDTGLDFCQGTPYEDWADEECAYLDVSEHQTLANAKAFRDYLADLRGRTVLTGR